MDAPAQVADAFPMDDAYLQDALLQARGQVIGHQIFDVPRMKRVQVQNSVNRKLNRFVHATNVAREQQPRNS